jgi:hypothetical protein
LVFERGAFLRLDADRVDLEDADVDLLPAGLRGAERGLEELELVTRGRRRQGGAGGDVVLDLLAPQGRDRRVPERLPGRAQSS